MVKICSERDCDREVTARGLCNKHYLYAVRHGLIETRERTISAKWQTKWGRVVPVTMDCRICGRPLVEHGVTEFCLPVEVPPRMPAPKLVGVSIGLEDDDE